MDKVRAFAFDMDGTLLNPDHLISEESKKTIFQLQERGYRIILCSGRHYKGLLKFGEMLDLGKYGGAICGMNGGMTYLYEDDSLQLARSIPFDLAMDFAEKWADREVAITFYYREKGFCYAQPSYQYIVRRYLEFFITQPGFPFQLVDRLEDVPEGEVLKLIISGQPDFLRQHDQEAGEAYRSHFDLVYSAPYFLEVMPKGVNKGEGLKLAAQGMGISPQEIIAFGDGENDIPMLEAAGLGLCMANGFPSTKAAADAVIGSNAEEGVSRYLQEHFLMD